MPHPILQLREVCLHADHGIGTILGLAAFMHIAPGVNQQDISHFTRQSDSSVSQWIAYFQLRGLIDCDVGKDGKRTTSLRYTPAGRALYDAVNAIFKHTP